MFVEFTVRRLLPLLLVLGPSEALSTLPPHCTATHRHQRPPSSSCLHVTSNNNADQSTSDRYHVRISPASGDGPDPSDPLVFYDDNPVSLTAQPYRGHLCRTVGEAMDRLVVNGFAVFESEEAMFATSASGEKKDDDDDDDDVGDYFSARWMKNTPRDSDDFRGLRKKDILYGGCKSFAAFARRLHYGITTHRSSSCSSLPPMPSTEEEFIGAICLCSPITRGLSLNNNNVYSLHQDPCFFTSLFDRHRKLQAEIAELEAEIAAGLQDDDVDDDYDDDDDDDDEDDDYDDGPIKDPLSEKVIHAMEQKSDQLSNDSTQITMRQVNFWLPHSPNGDKHLVFLTREASTALASFRITPRNDNDDDSYQSGEANNGRTVDSGNEDGDLWVTERGLDFIREEMPDHVFVTNRPLVFVSGNSEDSNDPLFHCGAIITGRGSDSDDDSDCHGVGDGSCSSEIRIAVCSMRKKRGEEEDTQ